MPEIKNKIPTDEQLLIYLRENFDFVTENFDFVIPRYVTEAGFEEEAIALRLGCADFLAEMVKTVFRSLQRLNNLPRTDPFWNNTNKRPTVWCSEILNAIKAETPS